MPPTLYLIDGHALAYRTYFAITAGQSTNRMSTSSGEPTAAIYGFASVMMRLLEQEKPKFLAVAFDTGKTFRNELFPGYKATRAKMPDELRPQIERIRQMIDAFHVPRLEKEGVEADDILGTIAKQAVIQGLGVKIITGDRDLLQLVDDRVIINLAGSKLSEAKNFTPEEVKNSLGIYPSQVVDYKALVGDHSDNIPGVPGIGEKTAVSLLEQYKTLDAIYAHLEEIPARFSSKLKSGKDSAYLSKDLATIRTDVEISLNIQDARTDHINAPAIEKLFRELEFRSLIPRLHTVLAPLSAPETAGAQLNLFGSEVRKIGLASSYTLETIVVDSREKLQDLAGVLKSSKMISLDTETTSTDPLRSNLVGMSFAVKEGTGYYIPIGHKTSSFQLPLEEVVDALGAVLSDPSIVKVGHNLKYDGLVLEQNGLPVTLSHLTP